MMPLKPRERESIIQALRAGVVPKVGLRNLQVGRAREVGQLVNDIERIAEGGTAIRLVIGEYGSGKTFFLNLVRLIALEKGLVVMSADLAPDRRLHATGGQARGLYVELARNLATRTRPEGGAMANVLERFVGQIQVEAETRGQAGSVVIRERLEPLEGLVGGFAFANVVLEYWAACEACQDERKVAALRWLRGEFATRTDARQMLGVRTIIDDAGVYDHLKLMSVFVCMAGYKGLLVCLDELVNLCRLTSSQARNANFEQILRIVNDVLQGGAANIGFLMGGTPEFLLNTRRGLYSYEALQSRLTENAFVREGMVDLSGPVIRLANLTPEDLFVLLANIRAVMLPDESLAPDAALEAFMAHCSERVGEAYFRTPRNTVTAFVQFLAVITQNPDVRWPDLVGALEVGVDTAGDDLEAQILQGEEPANGELASFRL